MNIRFSALNRYETPVIRICNPGSIYQDGYITKSVSILSDISDVEFVYNFNQVSELNFRVNKIRGTEQYETEQSIVNFNNVQTRRLLFVEDIGYFAIVDIKEGYDGGLQYKDVTANSIEIELQAKTIPYIPDGTYKFAGDAFQQGLLDKIVDVLPLWTVGEVAASVAEKYRTFEDNDVTANCLSFMLENMQDAYECIFLFDIINRTINVYDQNDYVVRTNIHLTKDDFINSLDMTEKSEDIYTAINALGSDERITINAINPLGSNVIYDFSYYLNWMSPALKEKVQEWQASISPKVNEDDPDTYFDQNYSLNLDYYNALAAAAVYQANIGKLDIQLTMYKRCRDNIVAEAGNVDLVEQYNIVIIENGGQPIETYEEIADTLSGIDELIASCENDHANNSNLLAEQNIIIDNLRAQISSIREATSLTTCFTPSEYEELIHFIYEGSYSDEYVTITDSMSYDEQFEQMKILYDRAKERLNRVSSPTQEFSVDVENFVFVKEFEEWSEQLETGCLINVELNEGDIAALFLSSMTINYEDHSLSMTFGNRFNKYDVRSLFEDVLGNVAKSANTLTYVKEILYPIKNGELNQIQNLLQSSRDITMNNALASNGEEVVIDGSGYTGRKKLASGEYDPRQIKIVNNSIAFTDNAWDSAKVAIGELSVGEGDTIYGVNAQALIGDVIVGNELRILDNNGNDMFAAIDGKIQTNISDARNELSTQINQNASEIQAIINGGVDQVTTATGFTFNSDGLTIQQSGQQLRNIIDPTGMYVLLDDGNGDDSDDVQVLIANNDGVDAINLTARQYLIIGGNSRFEDYETTRDSHRTGCFYIGE